MGGTPPLKSYPTPGAIGGAQSNVAMPAAPPVQATQVPTLSAEAMANLNPNLSTKSAMTLPNNPYAQQAQQNLMWKQIMQGYPGMNLGG